MCTALAIVAATFALQAEPNIDDRVQWIRENAIAVQSIDPDDADDFSDLMPLKQAIGESRLVVLGEQSHGDGAVFLAKARLVKFLHKEMGFDVLAWESGMFDCREVDRALKDPNRTMDEISTLGIFPIWTYSAQVKPTLEYVRSTLKTERPIETCGFDHQFSGGLGPWPQTMLKYLDSAGPGVVPADLRSSLEAGLGFMSQKDVQQFQTTLDMWKQISPLMVAHKDALEKASSSDEFAFMRRTADDAITSLISMQEFLAVNEQFRQKLNNTRDLRMGDNLIWLVNEKYKDRKIIAWMATFHAAHDLERISMLMNPTMYEGVVNCGTVAHKALGDTMYTIGFTAADGKAGNVWAKSVMDLPEPTAGSLEDLCVKTGKPFLLIDFDSLPADHWLQQPMISRPLGYGEMSAVWPNQMDAMFYIQTMFPSTRANVLPMYAKVRADQK